MSTEHERWHAYQLATNRLEDLQPWESHLIEAQTAKVALLRDIAAGPEWLAIPIKETQLTTVKRNTKDKAEAYLSLSDKRTGLKPYSERMKVHAANALENPFVPKGGPVVPSDVEIDQARALLKRSGIDIDSQAALDHCVVYQDVALSTAAARLGGSCARYSARDQFEVYLKSLAVATEKRHTERGAIVYKRTHANLAKAAAQLEALGGERVTWPKALPSDFDAAVNV